MQKCRLNPKDQLPLDLLIPDLAAVCSYALEESGKQVRPALAYLAFSTITPGSINLVPVSALELIHTYSLIHDDLPAMDDDDMRRGKPSLHKAFDEATAILVGDGLQARAFELLADAPDLSVEQKVRMIKVLAQASGFEGMVGGQYIDIQAVDSDMTLEELQAMHEMKTGALVRASLALGGIAANGTDEQLAALDEYGKHIGLAFQVVDDILDVEGDAEALGKTAGKDAEANKPTYVKLLGLDGAKAEAKRLLQAAIDALEMFGDSADQLRDLARYIVERDR
ncbi:farnesyl-diphosphate synthase [Halioglobus japonicus]|uniref:Polyprenyl synthetase family protein n=1 Tax=Halioglobus japonicus TaxID=930805 RepID=A0AAP8MBQ8_9GAMM|nr:farnesyl diphosphate synthase [Halioglobus japonicus]AQA20069.1 farnesyl-diphosphate synthase [Halioglobus japonicus]AQA20394.1 farnesyl-diphosphate synthase [Halioglobus japonicus]PLW84882.1 polyprenyl synthetase family protein [Halioglobus japonicus]